MLFSSYPNSIVRDKLNTVNNSPNDLGTIPLYFIPNMGQAHRNALFYSRTPLYTLWLTQDGIIFDSIMPKGSVEHSAAGLTRDVSRMVFPGANKNPQLVPDGKDGPRVNYIKGKNQAQWLTNVKTSKAIRYKNLFKKIDLKIYGVENLVEYDWVVKPGANPADICVQYKNVKSTRIDEAGNLIVDTRVGALTHKRPVAYQEINGKIIDVVIWFDRRDKDIYGFRVGCYDKKYNLIIDPIVMAYSTYLGGGGDDQAFAMAVDISGNVFISGTTYSTDFPTDDAYQGTFKGVDQDAFLTKFTSTGLVSFSTFFGGTDMDSGEGVALDSNGRIYITGITGSTDFPTKGAYQSAFGGGDQDAVLTIFTSSGDSLINSTYLGGDDTDKGYALALDDAKNVYITGRTDSTNFPAVSAYQSSHGGGKDAFVAKFSTLGAGLDYSTYLGGSADETAYGIAVYGSHAIVTGRTASSGFPKKNEYQTTFGGGTYDAFVTKLSTQGKNLIFSTFLGGSSNDTGYGIVVDTNGSVYIAGGTVSSDFPTLNAYQDNNGGSSDAFVAKFASSGTTMEFSTYLGGSETDAAAHIALNNAGSLAITGHTSSSDFPLVNAYQSNYMGAQDAFASILSPNGAALNFSTLLGGNDLDTARSIGSDGNGNIFVAGYTSSTDYPTQSAYQDTRAGQMDAFVSKLTTAGVGSLCGAVDNCTLNWTTGGDADWFDQSTDAYYDGDSAQTGFIGDNQSTYMQTTIEGPGELSFYWKVSSSYSDRLYFYIDGDAQTYISGSYSYTNWTKKTYSIPAGSHTLKWSYEKNSSYTYGDDAGWVDRVVFAVDNIIQLDRDHLTFGAVQGSSAVSTGQTFSISNSATDSYNWTATTDQKWISCSPISGSSDAMITVSVDPTGLSVGTYTGSVSINAPGASNSPQSIAVTLNVYKPSKSSPPFGSYASPSDGATLRSSVAFTGWVLDDLGVQSVKLYRMESGSPKYIGEAVFVEGARPDVELAYPNYPNNYKAGWGYMMLTNYLPTGNGTFTIIAIATDKEGNQTTLGSKTVKVDNANAVKPFGALDTPRQGGSASGSIFINWGWVLTPQPNRIPTDGSTINVWVDSVNIGNPTYNIHREDIITYFPGYANTNGAVGYFYLDTTKYENGVHSIQWTATDSGGNTDGIGSRYFTITNTSGSSRSNAQADRSMKTPAPGTEFPVDTVSPVKIHKGFGRVTNRRLPRPVSPGINGNITVEIKEMERFELHLGRGDWSGWMIVGNQYRKLPVGSHFDKNKNIFSWFAAFGYVGEYRLVFVKKDQSGNAKKKEITVKINSKY